jgi:hypothetical protein
MSDRTELIIGIISGAFVLVVIASRVMEHFPPS